MSVPSTAQRCLLISLSVLLGAGVACATEPNDSAAWSVVRDFLASNCLDCHDGEDAEAGRDLREIEFEFRTRNSFDRWVLIHDRIRDGEMPPPDEGVPEPVASVGWSSLSGESNKPESLDTEHSASRSMIKSLARLLVSHDRRRVAIEGRAKVRRLNRFEYENTLRAVLDAPWLQVADMLPEDGVEHLFNKSGERLDVSHVQLSRFLEASEKAVRLAVSAAAYPTNTQKFMPVKNRPIITISIIASDKLRQLGRSFRYLV